jgi:hypothetical protein
MGCSNPATTTVQVPAYQNPVPAIPGAPSLVQYGTPTGPQGGSVTFQWNAVSGATNYEVYHSGAPQTAGVEINGTQATVTGLYAPGTVNFAVAACNSAGCSQPSPTTTFTIPSYTAPAPGTAGALTLAGTGISGSTAYVEFAWSSVANSTSYEIVNAITGAVVWSGSGQNATLTGLSPGGTAHYALRACNSAGCGSAGPTYTLSDAGY